MKALIIVDVQNDFCPGGAQAVENGDTIVQGINDVALQFNIVATTQDWHPQNHMMLEPCVDEAKYFGRIIASRVLRERSFTRICM